MGQVHKELKNCKRKIFIYTEAFFPNIGGGESYTENLAETLSSLKYEVTVLTPVRREKSDSFPFEVIRLSTPLNLGGFNINFLEVLNILKENKNSLLHISGPTTLDSVLILICRFLQIPVILTFHGKLNSRLGKLLLNVTGRHIYPLANVLIVQSERDQEYIKKLNKKNNLRLLHFNGVNKDIFQCPNEEVQMNERNLDRPFTFIFIGGMTSSRPYKGVGELISIFKDANDRIGNKIRLILIGTGDLLKEMKIMAKDYSNIIFKGNLPESKLVEELCNSDALVLPSVSDGEGFGRVVLEALSCKRFVLVSKYAGVSELINKYNAGMVFDPRNVSEAIDKIKFILNNREKLSYYINNGVEMIENEDLDLMSATKSTIDIYNDIFYK